MWDFLVIKHNELNYKNYGLILPLPVPGLHWISPTIIFKGPTTAVSSHGCEIIIIWSTVVTPIEGTIIDVALVVPLNNSLPAVVRIILYDWLGWTTL